VAVAVLPITAQLHQLQEKMVVRPVVLMDMKTLLELRLQMKDIPVVLVSQQKLMAVLLVMLKAQAVVAAEQVPWALMDLAALVAYLVVMVVLEELLPLLEVL
jgi:hypothetical protein